MADGNNKKQLGDFTRDFKQRGETFVLVDQSPQRCDFGGCCFGVVVGFCVRSCIFIFYLVSA